MIPRKRADAGTARHRLFSLSSMFRSQTRTRVSCIPETVQEEPTCREKIHYPIFNPQDPRHNPEIAHLPQRPPESSSSSSRSPTPISWMQTISRRSFHRARSGLLALRAEFNHRFSEEETPHQSFVNPVALRREREQHDKVSVAFTASTQEDPSFGTEIFRTSAVPTRPTENSEIGSPYDISSEYSVSEPFTAITTFEPKRKLRPRGDAVSNGIKPTYMIARDRDLDFQFSGPGEFEADVQFDNRAAHTNPSTDNHLTHSPWGVAFSTNQENEVLPDEMANPWPVWAEHQTRIIQHPNLSPASSDTQIIEDPPSPIPLSRQCSAEVGFAFPGIYHEMMEQCAREHDNPCPNDEDSHPSQHCPSPSGQEQTPIASHLIPQDGTDDAASYHEDDESLIPPMPSQAQIPQFEEIQPLHRPNPFDSMPSWRFDESWSSNSGRPTTQWSSLEEYSSRYTTDNTASHDIASTEMTSMASMSNDTWSPIESEVLFPSPVEDGNEYFLVDGKTSGQRPDRGNQAIKSSQHPSNNYSIPIRAQESAELIPPRTFSLKLEPGDIPVGGLDFLEEDTDDEFYPGIE
ncbi:hypothetical protein N7457_002696 [Penicillium paradoxum]|uniref:uncharacterized protein n=1 Tax=Penicillium paradoxum TaxID=176176 RepID=UPI0025490198|nr:uncharacterized protein N7457_002696 [Penicillium paradoxum]KAJ5787706.1 hypothetical protein N7457_002696 [Penicillium paradoxum]